MNNVKTYSELIKFKSFDERYEYLKLNSKVGEETFGFDRYLNQDFYKSKQWQDVRNKVIARDKGCDLGCSDREIICGKILIHHMNPIKKEDILNNSEILLNPEYLITTTKNTHDAIHYGNKDMLYEAPIERSANDTCPWKQ